MIDSNTKKVMQMLKQNSVGFHAAKGCRKKGNIVLCVMVG